ncbi:Hypothetical_protein [Hexamita inflata]|uniref:Hypothetical_protein n=1 Tax=Hexamita inflata TaxID=28002 RepID=A0ABP1IKN5_9EUKA
MMLKSASNISTRQLPEYLMDDAIEELPFELLKSRDDLERLIYKFDTNKKDDMYHQFGSLSIQELSNALKSTNNKQEQRPTRPVQTSANEIRQHYTKVRMTSIQNQVELDPFRRLTDSLIKPQNKQQSVNMKIKEEKAKKYKEKNAQKPFVVNYHFGENLQASKSQFKEKRVSTKQQEVTSAYSKMKGYNLFSVSVDQKQFQ